MKLLVTDASAVVMRPQALSRLFLGQRLHPGTTREMTRLYFEALSRISNFHSKALEQGTTVRLWCGTGRRMDALGLHLPALVPPTSLHLCRP